MLYFRKRGDVLFSVILLIDKIEDEEERDRIKRLYALYTSQLFGYIQIRFGFSKEDAEDAIELIFERLIRYRKTLNSLSENDEHGFLMTICRCVCLDKIKMYNREKKHRCDWPDDAELSDTAASFDQVFVEGEEDKEHLHRILDIIHTSGSPSYEIFVLKFVKKMKNTEIAKTLHLNPSTVSTIVQRTIEKIKKEIGCDYE